MRSQAYLIEAEKEVGLAHARTYTEEAFALSQKSPDDVSEIVIDTFSVQDARRAIELSLQKSITGPYRILIIATAHIFAEAQNALLKLFEEPPQGVTIFLIVPSRGLLLPTLQSRLASLPIQKLNSGKKEDRSDDVDQFIFDSKARAALLKKFANGKDDVAREKIRTFINRTVDRAEELVYEKSMNKSAQQKNTEILADLEKLRMLLHERSSPTRLILEHLALVLPKDLVR